MSYLKIKLVADFNGIMKSYTHFIEYNVNPIVSFPRDE